MSNIIRIKYVDFWKNFKLEDDMIYNSLLRLGYEVQVDNNPDVLVYSLFGYEHLNYDCVRIFYTGENRCPDFNICDYALGFDNISFGDRYMRAPLYFHKGYREDYQLMMQKHLPNAVDQRKNFCSFTVSNGNADPFRKDFFEMLSKYKKVSSGGRFENNLPDGKPVKNKLNFDREHKFSIAFENVSQPGYTTEKIMQAFAGGCIPIYWGNPDIANDFNAKAFVNVMEYDTPEQAIERIIEIDNNDELYWDMIKQPAILKEQMDVFEFENQFDNFVNNIIKQEPNKRKRVSEQFCNRKYREDLINMQNLYSEYNNNIITKVLLRKLLHIR